MPLDLDAVSDLIARRRSLGLARLKPDAIDRSIIERMLEAANWAPSNGDTEPWRFTVYTGDSRVALGQAFADAYKEEADRDGDFNETGYQSMRERGVSAPLWISIGMTPKLNEDGSFYMSEDEEIMAVACAVQNLHLVATAAGMIGMWHSKGMSTHPSVAKFVGLEAPSRLLGFFWCGYPNVDWPEGERGPVSDKVTWA
jgi:nitroreductase